MRRLALGVAVLGTLAFAAPAAAAVCIPPKVPSTFSVLRRSATPADSWPRTDLLPSGTTFDQPLFRHTGSLGAYRFFLLPAGTCGTQATLYIGANVKQTGYRMDDHFGDDHGNANLNNAILTYTEVRTGLGLDWKFLPAMTLSAEVGYQPYRSFDFHRADINFRETGSAIYGGVSLHGAF